MLILNLEMQELSSRRGSCFFIPRRIIFREYMEWIFLSNTSDFLELIPQRLHFKAGEKLALF
jgi:hypothetical protein